MKMSRRMMTNLLRLNMKLNPNPKMRKQMKTRTTMQLTLIKNQKMTVFHGTTIFQSKKNHQMKIMKMRMEIPVQKKTKRHNTDDLLEERMCQID